MRTSTRTPPSDRDRRRADLAEQLRQRRQAAHVVDHADRGDRRGAEQDRAGLAVGRQPDPAGDLDPGEDRQAGEARHRPVVQAALLRRVDRADPVGEALGVGNQQPGDRGGCEEGEDGVGCRGHCAVPGRDSGRAQATRRRRQPRGRRRPAGSRIARVEDADRGLALAQRQARRVVEDPQPALGDQRLVDPAHAPGEGGEDGGAERDRLAVHRAAGADHEVGEGDQALGVDRPLGDDQVGGAERPHRGALATRCGG